MSFKRLLKNSFQSIISNKMRTFLTLLGIIIGVTSVVVIVGIAQGTYANITETIESTGTNLISVYLRERISYDEIMKFEENEYIETVSPEIAGGAATVKYGEHVAESQNFNLYGVNEKYIDVNPSTVMYGRFISNLDVVARNKVVVLGYDIFSMLGVDVGEIYGKKVKINGDTYTVIGVLNQSKDNMMRTSNNRVFIPVSTYMRINKVDMISNFSLLSTSPETSALAGEYIEQRLTQIFGDSDKFYVARQEAFLEALNEITKEMTLMLGGIAAISLLVGGIGIMNIMLVSVTERVKEIGIRKALGAKRRDIMRQFIVEAAAISAIGGVIGILLAIGIGSVISNSTQITIVNSPIASVVAFGFSVLIGLFFGIYPANKAAKLKPVDALRYE